MSDNIKCEYCHKQYKTIHGLRSHYCRKRPRSIRGMPPIKMPENQVNVHLSINASMADIVALPPEQARAFLAGIAHVLAARNDPPAKATGGGEGENPWMKRKK
jgi:hypothetical protein